MPSSVKSTPRSKSRGHYQRKTSDLSNELQLKRDEQTAARYEKMISVRTKAIGDVMEMAQRIEHNRQREKEEQQRAYFHAMHLAYRSRGALNAGPRTTSLFASPLPSHSEAPADSSRTASTRSVSDTISVTMRSCLQKQQKAAAQSEPHPRLHAFPVESEATVNRLYQVKARPLARVYC